MDDTATGTVARGRTMKAIVRNRHGSADVLEFKNVEVPRFGDDEVLVRVRAAGLDRGVWHIMAVLPYLILMAGYGLHMSSGPHGELPHRVRCATDDRRDLRQRYGERFAQHIHGAFRPRRRQNRIWRSSVNRSKSCRCVRASAVVSPMAMLLL